IPRIRHKPTKGRSTQLALTSESAPEAYSRGLYLRRRSAFQRAHLPANMSEPLATLGSVLVLALTFWSVVLLVQWLCNPSPLRVRLPSPWPWAFRVLSCDQQFEPTAYPHLALRGMRCMLLLHHG